MKKLFIFVIFSVALFATQNNVNILAKFSAPSVYNLDGYSLKETLSVYLKSHPKIKALKIIEEGNQFITYHFKDGKQVFYKPIPDQYLNLVKYTSNIIYQDKNIGQIIIYYENHFIAHSLTKNEKLWLQNHPTIKVSNELDWAPYDYAVDNEAKGYSVEYMRILADKIGIEFEFISASWNELLQKFQNKEIDMMHVMSKTKPRESYTLFSDSYVKMNLSIITKKNSTINRLEDLNNKKLALAKGWSSTNFIKENYPNIQIIEKEFTQEILNEVAFGNADAAIEDRMIANYYINKNFLTNLHTSKSIYIPSFNQNLHIGIRDDWEIFHGIIQKALKSVQYDELSNLNKKWSKKFEKDSSVNFTTQEFSFIKKQPTIVVGGETDWPPFDYVENGKYQGVAKEYLDLIEKYSGLRFIVKTGYTWNELLNMAKNKEIDMLPMLYFSKNRTEFLNFTNNYLNIRHYLYTKEETPQYKNLKELSGKKIAILKGSAQVDLLKEKYPKIKILETKNSLEAIDKVISNEADAFIESTALVTYLLKKHNIKGIKGVFPTQLGVNKLYMATRKDWPILRDIIQKSIDAIPQKEHERITKKWINSDIQTLIDLSNEEEEYLRGKKELTLCIKPNLIPYEYLKDGNYYGIASDYMDIISKKLNIPTRIIPVTSNKETTQLIKSKKCDLRSIMFTKRATQVPYNVSSPYLEDHIVLVTTIEKPFVKDLSNNLDKVYVIEKAQKGIVNIVKKKYPDIRLKYVDTIEKAYQMVLDQEVYGYIGKSLSTMHIIQKNYSSTLKIMTQLFKMNLGVGVNEDEPELLNIINKVLQTIDEQTKIQIRNNWSSTTIETKVDYTYLWYLLLAMFVIVSLVVYRQIILNRSNALLEKTNKKLLDQKKEFETIFSSSKDGIAIVDLESHFLNCNEAYCEMLGYTKEELLTMSCIGLTLPEERQNAILALEEILTVGYKTNFEKLCLRKDDTIVTVNMTGSIYPDKKRILLISKDISSNKLLEEQSKLASMGEMIGNIAHQWRQPLSVITTASTGALYQKEIGTLTDEFFEKEMNNINDQAQYLSRTIDDFRNFIKGDQEEVEIKINEAIEYAIHLTEATLKNNYINTVIDLDDDMEIHGSKNELIQSFINIINNSKDALKEKCEEEDRYIFISSSKKSENSLEIKICDTGGGIPDDVIERIFEPYFTTKHQNVGTGIGLSMVNKILRDKYHAQIQVNNQHTNYKDKEYYGACFKILFHRN